MSLLLTAGVPSNEIDKTDLTPAMCAQINNHKDITKLLEAHLHNGGKW